MANNYYCLVAGLREYSMGTDLKSFDAEAIIEEVRRELSKSDLTHLGLLYEYYDIENLVNAKAGRKHFSSLGNIAPEKLLEDGEGFAHLSINRQGRSLLKTLGEFFAPPLSDSEKASEELTTQMLFEKYYSRCAMSSCSFVRQWGEFDRNLRNVCAAVTARKSGVEIRSVVVGGGYVAEMLCESPAADFDLRGELDYIDGVIAAVNDEQNLLKKEKQIDDIRWEMAEQLAEFNYFDINKLLSYLVKVNIIHRWKSLDVKVGQEMFDRLVDSLSGSDLIDKAMRSS